MSFDVLLMSVTIVESAPVPQWRLRCRSGVGGRDDVTTATPSVSPTSLAHWRTPDHVEGESHA